MNLYATDDEERVQAAAQVREWTRSGLLDASRGTAIEAGLRTDLKRTNRYLRIALFIFGTIVVAAAFGFFMLAFDVSHTSVIGWSAIVAGVASGVLAQLLVVQFQLYRFGVEEAFAVWSVALLAVGTGLLTPSGRGNGGDPPMLVACLTAAIASGFVFVRFGYLYAALAGVICAGAAALNLDLTKTGQRIVAACVLLVIFAVVRGLRRTRDDDFRSDDYKAIESVAWLGVYAVLNLHLLFTLNLWVYRSWIDFPPVFYWATYAAIWLLPLAGLALAVRDKHRYMLWANLTMVLATLATNKPYLGWERHTWDPMLLGGLVVAAAMGVRRWLSLGPNGHRGGFTAQPLVASADRQTLDALGMLAVAAQPFAPRMPGETPAVEPGRGGRSGGGGGGADF
jgi:hypothetical protein